MAPGSPPDQSPGSARMTSRFDSDRTRFDLVRNLRLEDEPVEAIADEDGERGLYRLGGQPITGRLPEPRRVAMIFDGSVSARSASGS